MSLILYGIPNCGTVRKARAALAACGVRYVFHDYKTAGVSPALLERWIARVGWERLLNRQGTTFRKLSDADKRDLDADKALAIMLAHPSTIRRPIAELGDELIVGFDRDRYGTLA